MLKKLLSVLLLSLLLMLVVGQEPAGDPVSAAVGGEPAGDPVSVAVGGEPAGDPVSAAVSARNRGGQTFPPLEFDIDIGVNRTQAFRGDWVRVNFKIQGNGGKNGDTEEISIRIPDDFVQINAQYTINNKLLSIPWNTSMRALDIYYDAQITKDFDLGIIIISSDNVTFTKVRTKTKRSYILNINNSLPKILDFHREDKNVLYINDTAYMHFTFKDIDDDKLIWKLYDNDDAHEKLSDEVNVDPLNRTQSIIFSYLLEGMKTHNVYIELTDRFNSTKSMIVSIPVERETRTEHDFKFFLDNIYWITLVIIVLSIGALKEAVDKRLKNHWIQFGLDGIWIIIIYMLHDLNLIQIDITPFFALAIYPIIISSTLYFIINNFSKEHYKHHSAIRYISLLGIGFSMIFLFYLFQSNFSLKTDSFYLYYYSTMIQFFGTILAIITAFAVFFFQRKRLNNKDKKEFKNKLRLFMIFYIFIILVAIIGLGTGFKSDLNLYSNLNLISTLSLISFECTLLLIIPALVILYALVDWIIERN